MNESQPNNPDPRKDVMTSAEEPFLAAARMRGEDAARSERLAKPKVDDANRQLGPTLDSAYAKGDLKRATVAQAEQAVLLAYANEVASRAGEAYDHDQVLPPVTASPEDAARFARYEVENQHDRDTLANRIPGKLPIIGTIQRLNQKRLTERINKKQAEIDKGLGRPELT